MCLTCCSEKAARRQESVTLSMDDIPDLIEWRCPQIAIRL